MKRIVSFLLLALCVIPLANAQNDNRPGWVDNKPKASNSTFIYVIERGSGPTVNEAINSALLKVMRNSMMRIGAVVDWDEVNASLQQGADWGTISQKYKIPINKVCEYVEHKTDKGFLVVVLCQVAKSGNVYPEFDDFSACTDTRGYSNGLAVLESALLPGLGQMSKRHYGSGIFTLLGEVVLVGGAVGSYYLAQEELSTMQDPNISINNFSNARKKYNLLRTANIACLSAAGVLYVINLVRAGTMSPKYKKDKLSFTPELIPVNDKMGAGVNITLKF